MKSGVLGSVVILIIVSVLIVLSTGIGGDDIAPEVPPVEITQNNTPTPIPTNITSLTAEPEKVSAEALACTIVTSGYEVDLRLKNPGTEPRTVDINPPGRTVVLSPGQTKRVDLLLANEGMTMQILVDDGTELLVESPLCVSRGSSGGRVSSHSTEQLPAPIAPVPELPTLALISAGIVGLLLVLRNRKN